MKNKYIFSISILFILAVVVVFKSLFQSAVLSGGDYIIFWPENIAFLRNFSFFAWDATVNFGSNSVGLLHYAPYNLLISWIGFFVGDRTYIWERIVWWIPFFAISFYSMRAVIKRFFPKNNLWFFAPFIFIFNTYVLMLLGGGQIAGIGLAYAIAPLVLLMFMNVIELCVEIKFEDIKRTSLSLKLLKYSLISGLFFAIQIMFDLRIAYITLISIGLYIIMQVIQMILKNDFKNIFFIALYTLIIPFGCVGFLNAFWLIPLVIFKVNTINELGAAFNSVAAVKFFSFATFENTLSLLHPNWPENLFGKIYFMRSEFLVIPILTFGSLLFITKKDKKEKNVILFFSLLGLIGAFLAKGANDPFGGIYIWLFNHFPGFIMFRDSTKFYLLIAIAYSVLIPFCIFNINNWFKIKFKYASKFFVIFIFIYFLFLIRFAILGELSGIFKSVQIPKEYLTLKNFISSDSEFSRVLWIPQRQRFVMTSRNHPAVDAESFLKVSSPSSVLSVLNNSQNENLFQGAGIKYVILPDDTEKEIFLKNSKYDQKLYLQFKNEINKLKWLKRVDGFENILVYQVSSPKDRFWINSKNATVDSKTLSPTNYSISVKNVRKGDKLIFNDSFDQYWRINFTSDIKQFTASKAYDRRYNSFILPKDGNYQFEIYYAPQKWVFVGTIISLIALIQIFTTLFLIRKL